MVHFHHARHHQPIDFRPQAADVGGEFERKHGHGAIGKINTGAAQASFLIERRVRRDVVGDVGNVHLKLKVAVFQLADATASSKSRAVSPSIVTIGNERKSRRLRASAAGMMGSASCASCENRRREAMRQVKLADDDFHIRAEIVFVAENFDDAPAGILGGGGPVGDLDVHHYIFQVVPIGAACGFVHPARDRGFLLALAGRTRAALHASQQTACRARWLTRELPSLAG